MSIQIMVQVGRVRFGNPTRKLIALFIADMANSEGFSWPSMAKMAAYAEVHPRSVQRHIRALEKMGLLVRSERKRPNGSTASNGYQFVMEGETLAVLLDAASEASPPDTGVTPPPDTGVTPAPDTGVTPLTLKEPSNKKRAAISAGAVVDLSDFQKARLRSGQSVVIAGERVLPGSPAMVQWQKLLRKAGSS